MNEDLLVWVDLETTGLDPWTGRILEVAMVVTGPDCVPIARKESLVGPVPSSEDVADWPEVVREMHTNSGLLRDLSKDASPVISWVDGEFAKWLQTVTPGEKLVLAGSTVRFDRAWIDLHMIQVARMLHYRMADVSGVREFFRRWLPDHDARVAESFTAASKHRAGPDLVDSIALASTYRRWVNG